MSATIKHTHTCTHIETINKQPKSMTNHKEHKTDTKPQKEQNNKTIK